MNNKSLILLCTVLMTSGVMRAQTAKRDTLGASAKGDNRNVMLNAADSYKPREIQIGLPSEDVNVYENGLPAVYSSSVHKLSAHWRNDASLKGTSLMTPAESAIATGNIAYAVNAESQLGISDKAFSGVVNWHGNHYGLNTFDLNLNGRLARNWYWTASMYQNFDQGRRNSATPTLPTVLRSFMPASPILSMTDAERLRSFTNTATARIPVTSTTRDRLYIMETDR